MNGPVTMQSRVMDYLAERRRLGFELQSPGTALMDFARYVDSQDHVGPLTIGLMVGWARCDHKQQGKLATWAKRLKLLRPFTRYLRQFEPLTEVPDWTVFGPIQERFTPHIYHDQEIIDLLSAARGLRPEGGLRPSTYEALFGLIASAGLRVSEAIHLLDADADLEQGMLTIRQTKFAKSRQLPLHPSTVAALLNYRQLRNRYVRNTAGMPFFVNSWGKRLGLGQVDWVFSKLRDQLGWPNRGAHRRPRIHDLRHTFAVRRVMLWHKHGTDIDQAMLALSTYMGHAKISNTYWYLTAVPELMAIAAEKFESYAQAVEVGHG